MWYTRFLRSDKQKSLSCKRSSVCWQVSSVLLRLYPSQSSSRTDSRLCQPAYDLFPARWHLCLQQQGCWTHWRCAGQTVGKQCRCATGWFLQWRLWRQRSGRKHLRWFQWRDRSDPGHLYQWTGVRWQFHCDMWFLEKWGCKSLEADTAWKWFCLHVSFQRWTVQCKWHSTYPPTDSNNSRTGSPHIRFSCELSCSSLRGVKIRLFIVLEMTATSVL